MATEIGRVALREVGDHWVGYYAPEQDSMEGAVEIARVAMGFVSQSRVRKVEFIDFVWDCYADSVERWSDVRPEINEVHHGA